jgi:glutathione S-transferase
LSTANSDVIKLYQFELSPFCQKISRILHWKHVPYEVVEVPASKARSIRAYSATSKLPAIEHNGKFIHDSTNIAYYLEEKFPSPTLIPTEREQQALCHVYEDWADESLYFYMMKLRWLPQNKNDWGNALASNDRGIARFLISKLAPKAVLGILDKQGIGRKSEEVALEDIRRHLKALAMVLEKGSFLLGDKLTLADLSVFVQLHCMQGTSEGKEVIASYENVELWMKRVDQLTDGSS